MDENLSDIVRDYRLTMRHEGALTIHFHNDPDAPPSSPQRREVWKKKCNIGRGGQGEVILQVCVEGSRHHTDRAVKKIWLQSRDSQSKRRYERELAAIIKFSHDRYSKYFVKSLGWYSSPTKLYIAMEYLSAGDLYTYVRERHVLTEGECRQVICQVLSGISLMHAEGFAHRDIKPQNLLIYRHPEVDPSTLWWIKMADFGISKRFSSDAGATTTASIGSLDYMAPELLRAEHSLSSTQDYQRADMWALGITAFFISTNTVPFQSPASTIQFSISRGEPFPSRHLDLRQMSQDGQDFIREAIKPQPKARPDCRLAMRHSWIWDLFNDISAPSIRDQLLGAEISEQLGMEVGIGHIDTVNSQLHCEGDVNTPDEAGSLSLSISGNGERGMTGVSDEPNPDVTPTNLIVHEALELATRKKQIEEMKMLIDRGCDVEARNSSGETPLYWAARVGSEAAVRLLIENKASPEVGGSSGATPLIAATRWRHFEVAKLLLEEGADVNASDDASWTPLMFSVYENSPSLTKLLITHGARLDTRNDEGLTALFLAAQRGRQDTLEILLEANSDIEARDNTGATSLIAAVNGGHFKVVKALLEQSANVEAKDLRGETALVKAIDKGYATVVKVLLEKGAEIEAKGHSGETALIRAAARGSATLVKGLLVMGAKIEAKDVDGETALVKAVDRGYGVVVKLLLEKGADYEAHNSQDKPCLVVAASRNYDSIRKLLLEKGAKRDVSYYIARMT
ncbi:CAMK kinase [Fusarium phyllophilum]|uniref:CAMK kinase n=1 Tax=Fusarium phyllophilum TaxID=47803 RepID=A0A8H5JKY4_9HYPO|nr:CAMK kinase [Fusarium phyllophilum]